MEQKAGAQISKRAFTQSVVILFVLMMIAGILTLVIPAESTWREKAITDGRRAFEGILASYGIVQPRI